MKIANFEEYLQSQLDEIVEAGTSKCPAQIITKILPATKTRGPRCLLDGFGKKQFIRMNNNSYMGLSFDKKVVEASHKAARDFGVGPGAVRFISGTCAPHVRLEKRLAEFHNRDEAIIFSSAYTTVMGVLLTLTTPETIIVSDELNHNCIINGIRLARPKERKVYRHLDMADFESKVKEAVGQCDHLIVITDGIFSMRGSFAPLNKMQEIIARYQQQFPRDILFVVDDSHGVGSFGPTGRGTEEYTGATGVDILVATLGKAFGVNGGYVVSTKTIIRYLREKNPFYIYTNPLTAAEAAAALAAIDIVDSKRGLRLLAHLRKMTARFTQGLVRLGHETLVGEHPVVPLLVRDTDKTNQLVKHLLDHGILATGINFPIIPKGQETIRFQVSADHTPSDIDYVLAALASFKTRHQ